MMKLIMFLKDGTMGDLGRNHNWSTFGDPHGSLVGDPHGRLVGDLQILVGDPQIFVGDPPMRRVSNSTILLMIFCY